ncbi:toluene tolerance protein [Pseudomonas sp. LPB0260]|uniref:phosphotransferase n=1 Tax=Pseudomonas sp. LPB0260 TaxID=2614442 RepID=UPI0015C230C0|nr:phosphotransferase [Pseudomonas sp. LPB0260]QLC73530.1 toluene tolerance protein [Pseudomonas sp. LPB0260]QLC76304.1 toluene tolerance protein [Pseudomonas sp. LPB0260]
MRRIDPTDYATLRYGAEVLEADSFGDKVLRLRDGNFIKLFRRKRLFSSALIWPYAARFARNAKALAAAGIRCPTVLGVYRAHDIERDIVYYAPLPGQTLRQLRESQAPDQLHEDLGKFVAHLHDVGVYFRSLHLGNIVLTPEGELGLIDIADLRQYRHALGKSKRLRNLRHLFRDPADSQWLESGPFLQSYRSNSKLIIDSTKIDSTQRR